MTFHRAPTSDDGPYIAEATACELLGTSQAALERLIQSRQLQAREIGGKRQVRSADVVSYLRRRKSREVQTRSAGASVTWFDDAGRETTAEPDLWSRTGAVLELLGPGSACFCTYCPCGPDSRPCEDCPAPVDPPEPRLDPDPKRSLFDRLFGKGKNHV